MFGTLTELHRWRYRVGIALAIAGTALIIFGVVRVFDWLSMYDMISSDAANGMDVFYSVDRSRFLGQTAIVALIFGMPLFMLGIMQVWLASRRNAMIEGAMIQMLMAPGTAGAETKAS